MIYASNEVDISFERSASERRLCDSFIETGLPPKYPCYIHLKNIHMLPMAKS